MVHDITGDYVFEHFTGDGCVILGGSCRGPDGLLFLIWGPHWLWSSVGMVPCFSEAWKNSVNVGVNSSACFE